MLSKKKIVDEMSNEEVSRWLCLFEAVNQVAARAQNMGYNIDNNNKWIKPLAFKNYISEMYQSTYVNYKKEKDDKNALYS